MTPPPAAAVRLTEVEKRAAVQDQRLATIEDDIRELHEAIKSLRNAVLTFAFTVAGSAIAVLLALAHSVR